MEYKFFMTPMCPNCGEIKDYLAGIELKGDIIDATTDEGLEEAKKLGVMGVPTMIFLDEDKEVNRADNLDDIRNIIENKSLKDV